MVGIPKESFKSMRKNGWHPVGASAIVVESQPISNQLRHRVFVLLPVLGHGRPRREVCESCQKSLVRVDKEATRPPDEGRRRV